MTVDQIQGWIQSYGPLAVGVGSTLDNTGVPIFFVAGLAIAGAVGVAPEALLVAAVIGSIVGDLGVYAIGRYFLTGDRIRTGRIGKTMAPVLNFGERAMARWGLWTILLGRFIPYVGKIVPFLAGSYKTAWHSTIAAVTIGSVLLMGLFYFYADSAVALVKGDASAVKTVSLVIGTVVVAAIIWANVFLKRREARWEEED